MTERLERLLNLVIALRETRRPMTAEEVRRRVAGYGQPDHEAFRRMFERDKADLRALGVPLETRRVDRWSDLQGYRIDPRHYDLPEVRLDRDELAALALALQATGLVDEAGVGLLKLEVDAGEAAPHSPRPVVGVAFEAPPHREVLLAAQLTRAPVRFRYRPPGREPSARTVDPHALVHRRGRWYLVGHDHDRGESRAFRLDRIAGKVTMAGEPGAFPPPPAVDVDDVVPAPAPGGPETAEVVAAPEVAWLVARRARGGGRPDAGGWTAYTVAVGDRGDFLRWVLELGPDLEVRGPAELRAEVVERLQRAAGGGR
ncbi:MAG TPA: WYL domain-containing protein [Egibacteraceae bacterium]|nr:WYL domain-containing protein [Egibacteraceae bacterium]